jgi:hypothetical protein
LEGITTKSGKVATSRQSAKHNLRQFFAGSIDATQQMDERTLSTVSSESSIMVPEMDSLGLNRIGTLDEVFLEAEGGIINTKTGSMRNLISDNAGATSGTLRIDESYLFDFLSYLQSQDWNHVCKHLPRHAIEFSCPNNDTIHNIKIPANPTTIEVSRNCFYSTSFS